MVIFDDLEAEQQRLENILDALDSGQWASASGAAGWTIADVVLHLAQSEEAVAARSLGDAPLSMRVPFDRGRGEDGGDREPWADSRWYCPDLAKRVFIVRSGSRSGNGASVKAE